MVFSRTVCPYCVNVKKLFTSLGVAYKEYSFTGDGAFSLACLLPLMGALAFMLCILQLLWQAK